MHLSTNVQCCAEVFIDNILIIPNSLLGDPFSSLAKNTHSFYNLFLFALTLILLVDLVAISIEPSHLEWFRVT